MISDLYIKREQFLIKLHLLGELLKGVSSSSAEVQSKAFNYIIDQQLKTIDLIKNCDIIIGSANCEVLVEADGKLLKLGDLVIWIKAVEDKVEVIDTLVLLGVRSVNIEHLMNQRAEYINQLCKYKEIYNKKLAEVNIDNLGTNEE